MPFVQGIARQARGRRENQAVPVQSAAQLVFLTFQAVELRLLADHLGQKLFHQPRHGRFPLRGANACLVVQLVIHRNCDVLHFLTVPNPAPRSRRRGSDGAWSFPLWVVLGLSTKPPTMIRLFAELSGHYLLAKVVDWKLEARAGIEPAQEEAALMGLQAVADRCVGAFREASAVAVRGTTFRSFPAPPRSRPRHTSPSHHLGSTGLPPPALELLSDLRPPGPPQARGSPLPRDRLAWPDA